MPSFDDTNTRLTHSIKIDSTAAMLSLRRLNTQLARTQVLLSGIGGGTAMAAGGGAIIGGRGATQANRRGILGQAAAISVLSDRLRGLGTAAKVGGLGLGAFFVYAGRQFAKWETAEFSLGLLTGSAKVGKKLSDDIKAYAATSPLTMAGVMQASRTLIAHNTAPENVMEQIKGLGNVATALGIKDLGRFVTPIARAQMMGNLQGQEYNMLIDAGFNVAGLSYKERVAAGAIKDTEENRKNFLANFKKYVMDGNFTSEELNRTLKYAGEVEYKGAADKAKNNLEVIMSGLFDTMSIAAERLFKQFNNLYDVKGKLKGLTSAIGSVDLSDMEMKMLVNVLGAIAIAAAAVTAPVTTAVAGTIYAGYKMIDFMTRGTNENEKNANLQYWGQYGVDPDATPDFVPYDENDPHGLGSAGFGYNYYGGNGAGNLSPLGYNNGIPSQNITVTIVNDSGYPIKAAENQ